MDRLIRTPPLQNPINSAGTPAPVWQTWLANVGLHSHNSIREYQSLADAVAKVGSGYVKLVIDRPVSCNANTTLPLNIVLEVLPGCEITIDSGVTLTIGNFQAGRYQCFSGSGTVNFTKGAISKAYPEWWGAIANNSTDCSAPFNKAIADLAGGPCRTFSLTSGIYRFTSATVQINARGFRFEGVNRNRDYEAGGTSFYWYGSGSFIQFGTDDQEGWDEPNYDGYQGQSFSDIQITAGDPTTALSNGAGYYKTGTWGIRDWRGGNIRLTSVRFENFYIGFFGVQSDINYFNMVEVFYNKIGMYIGPRSDQFTWDKGYAIYNDTALRIDGACGSRIIDIQFVNNGSSGTQAVDVIDDWSVLDSKNILFRGCWFEHGTGGYSQVPCFIKLDGDTNCVEDIEIQNPIVWNFYPTQPYCKYFIKIGNADYVKVSHFSGYVTYFLKHIRIHGTATGQNILWEGPKNCTFTWANAGTGTPNVTVNYWGDGRAGWFAGLNGRFFICKEPADINKDFYINSDYDGQVQVVFPDYHKAVSGCGDGYDDTIIRLNFRRRIIFADSAPASGDYERGDICFSTVPAASGYVGWVCVTSGTPGTWKTFGVISA